MMTWGNHCGSPSRARSWRLTRIYTRFLLSRDTNTKYTTQNLDTKSKYKYWCFQNPNLSSTVNTYTGLAGLWNCKKVCLYFIHRPCYIWYLYRGVIFFSSNILITLKSCTCICKCQGGPLSSQGLTADCWLRVKREERTSKRISCRAVTEHSE